MDSSELTKFQFRIPILLQAKIPQRGKQKKVGACEGFAYHSVKPVLLANGTRFEVDFKRFFFFLGGEALYAFKVLPCPKSDFFFTYSFVSVDSSW